MMRTRCFMRYSFGFAPQTNSEQSSAQRRESPALSLLENTAQARLALRQLFGDERLLVYSDGRMEGSARLPVVLREVGAGDPACTRRSVEVVLPLAA